MSQTPTKTVARVRMRYPYPKRRQRRKALGWIIWGMSAAFVLFQFSLQLSSGEIVGGLMTSFHLTALGGGVLASAYYYIYVALQTPAGMLVDRYGPRRLLSIGALVCGFGCMVFGAAHFIWFAVLGRLLMGTGAAFAFVGSLNLIAKWFPPRKFAMMAAIAETVGMIGTIFGTIFLAELVNNIGWRNSMVGAAAIAIILSVLIYRIVRDTPRRREVKVQQALKTYFRKDVTQLLKNKKAWLNGIYSGLMFSVITVFIALWAVPYIMKAHHLSLLKATIVCNFAFIGVAIAGPFIGWLDGKTCHRRVMLVTCSLVSAVMLAVIIYFPGLPDYVVIIAMFILGLFTSGYVLTFGVANEIVAPHMRSTSIGFVNTMSVGFAPIFQPLIGLLLELVSGDKTGHAYSIHAYQAALSVIPVIVCAAAIVAFFLPERGVLRVTK